MKRKAVKVKGPNKSLKKAPGTDGPSRHWDESLQPVLQATPGFPKKFLSELRAKKLTFGKRVHCPFLRPFFLSPEDEARVRRVSETIAAVAERVTTAALQDDSLFKQFHLRPEEERLARMNTGFGPASTASRLDAFLLPDSLKFTEYNGESPAGAGYSESLSEIFRATPVMKRVCEEVGDSQLPIKREIAGCTGADISGLGRDIASSADGDCGLERSADVERVRDFERAV